MPSVQLERYLQERADGKSVEEACFWSGIGLGEAALHEADIESGELELPLARAPAREGDQPGETKMEDVRTTIRVGDGPEVPIDLGKDISDPDNAEAKAAISGVVAEALNATSGQVDADALRLFIERVERLKEEIRGLNDDVRDIYAEARAHGYDKKAMQRIVKLREMEPEKLRAGEEILTLYMSALGMTPIETAIALAA